MKKLRINTITSLGVILSLIAILVGPLVQIAYAAALTGKSDTMTSLKASVVSNHTILFTTPTGVAAADTITLTLTSFSIASGLDFEDLDLSFQASGDGVCDTGDTEKTLAATASGSTWGAVRTSATVITFTSGTDTIVAGAEVCVEIGTNAEEAATGIEQITNPSAGSYTLAIGGTMTDSGSVAIEIISDDQVAATATVAESLTFTISANSIAFGTLTTANGRWADTSSGSASEATAHTIVVGTNGTSGYTLTVTGTTLTSGGNTVAAIGASAVASSPGSEQYGIKASASGGIGAVSAPYATADYALDTAAFPDQLGSASGASADTTYTLTYLANIASNTEAGSYTSTLTYTATATF